MSKKLPQLDIKRIQPKTENQQHIFEAFKRGSNLFINGSAGTGKTFVSMYLALNEMYNKPLIETDIHRITIIRSIVPSRDIGFLPGSIEEKSAAYEAPYRDITDDLFEREGMYDSLKRQGHIQFYTTSFMRGLTIDNSIVVIDEVQNMTDMEIHSIATRIGDNSRVVFIGDFFQSDIGTEKSGMSKFVMILKDTTQTEFVELGVDDVVRSGFVKEYLEAKMRFERNYE